MSDNQRSLSAPAVRCAFSIEKEWPGHRVVLSRRQCKNKVKPPYRYCHVHRYKELPGGF